MRAEDIVGGGFFSLLIPAVGVTISGSWATLSPRQKALRRGWGLGSVSCVLIAFALLNFQFIRNSPRPVVEGNLWNIQRGFRSGQHSSRFMVTDASGRAVLIRCDYDGPGLVDGERVRVRYVEYNEKLVEMDTLSGSYMRWHLRESSGENGWWWWALMGAICGYGATDQLKKARLGSSSSSSQTGKH